MGIPKDFDTNEITPYVARNKLGSASGLSCSTVASHQVSAFHRKRVSNCRLYFVSGKTPTDRIAEPAAFSSLLRSLFILAIPSALAIFLSRHL
jgi:hypothetical protein